MEPSKIVRIFTFVKTLESIRHSWPFSVYVLFLLANGLSLREATQLNVIYMVTNTLVDVFTGSIADKYSKKLIYTVGQLLWGVGLIVYGTGNGFWQFALAEIILALGQAAISNALESWLQNVVSPDIAHKARSRTATMASIFSIFSALIGSAIGFTLGFKWAWIVGGISTLVITVINYFLLASLPDEEEGETENKGSIKLAIKLTLTNKELLFITLFGIFTTITFQPINMFWSKIFEDSGRDMLIIAATVIGSMRVGISIFNSIGSTIVERLKEVEKKHLAIVVLSIGIPMFFASINPWFWGILFFFLLHQIGRGAIRPLADTYANAHIPKNVRATASSIQSTAVTFGSACGLLAFGILTDYLPPMHIWTVAASLQLIIGVVLVKLK